MNDVVFITHYKPHLDGAYADGVFILHEKQNMQPFCPETAILILLTLAWLTIVIVTIVMRVHLHPLHV